MTTKNMKKLLYLIILIAFSNVKAQTVTDFDGNVYETVVIGDQTWLKQNLKSVHYSDGAAIVNVVAYDNNEENATIYGRLYTWNAAMRNKKTQSTQGVCPSGWHLPSDAEWNLLINYLGGSTVAGGKMKESGTTHWESPNTGATNSSGFTALGSGEFDAHYTPNVFRILHQFEVYWTSTEVNTLLAKEKFLESTNTKCSDYDWYKTMKYSIRCVKDNSAGMNEQKTDQKFHIYFADNSLLKIYNDWSVTIINVEIYNIQGQLIINQEISNTSCEISTGNLSTGIYLVKIDTNEGTEIHKISIN